MARATTDPNTITRFNSNSATPNNAQYISVIDIERVNEEDDIEEDIELGDEPGLLSPNTESAINWQNA